MPSDVIREDKVVPYVHETSGRDAQALGWAAQNLPMAAMFMRNRALAWSSMLIAIQSWVNEPMIKVPGEDQGAPGVMKLGMAGLAIIMSYMDLIFPTFKTSGTVATETATSIVSAATATATTTA